MNLGPVWGPGSRLGTGLFGYFCVAFLPSDVMLLVSQELGRDKREARGYAVALPLYHTLHMLL